MSLGRVVMALSLLLGLLVYGEAEAARRNALVIGNGAYQHAPALPNPARDAQAVADALRDIGFEVQLGLDLDRRETERALGQFARALQGAETGLLFYAGHGLQVNGVNYIVPIDAQLEHEAELPFEAIRFTDVLAAMELATPVNIVFLDACRDNPLARNLARSMGASRSAGIGRGLAPVDSGIGTLIAFATQPGNVALDGGGEHSPFAKALLRTINAPGLEIRQVLSRVRQNVIKDTNGKQVPWDHSSLTGDVYLVAPPAAEPEPDPAQAMELAFWQAIEGSSNSRDYEAYLERFGADGVFAPLARNRMAALHPPTHTDAIPAATPTEAELAEPSSPEPSADQPIVAPAPALSEPFLGLTRQGWIEVQSVLTELGFDTQGIDGIPGPATRRALERWQESMQLPPTGELTSPQLADLRETASQNVAAFEAALPDELKASQVQPVVGIYPQSLEPGSLFKDCAECPEMVVIPAGSFRMGSPTAEAGRAVEEGPMRTVSIREPMAIGRFEVTFAEYDACVGDRACRRPADEGFGRGRQPVINVSWRDAKSYVAWLSRHTGRRYELPSEAFWEFAADAGGRGSNPAARSGQAVCDGCGSVYDLRRPAPVGTFRANDFGLYDMAGNVWEWVEDCWANAHDSSTSSAPRQYGNCGQRVVKGGSWASRPHRLRDAAREPAFVDDIAPTRGFRVARTLP